MSVTASRLGSAPITLDWSNLKSARSPGVRLGMEASPETLMESWTQLKARFSSGDVGFYNTPIQEELSAAKATQELVDSLIQKRNFSDCLFLGIGGSSLGPASLLAALEEKRRNSIRFHFMENPDPTDWKTTLSKLSPDTTLVCAVTKSGTTFETMAQLLLAMEWLGKQRLKSHLVVITDPTKGDLRAFANQEGLSTLPIAPSIGGRFSVFSPVGLFPAALAGLSVSEFLQGAHQVRDYCEKHAPGKNPLFIIGSELIRHYPSRSIHVCMPYSTRLKSLGAWFVQLWGESLGKDGKGFTPLAALGATDQHSILQLLRDGPDDKVTLFLSVDQVADEVKIPTLSSMLPLTSHAFPAFRLLEGHTLQELLQTEYRATSLVLTKQGRPNLSFALDRLDERGMGALYFAMSVLTAFTGTLWGVNPFDQPGVEEGKGYIREALSKAPPIGPQEDENSAVSRLRRDREQF